MGATQGGIDEDSPSDGVDAEYDEDIAGRLLQGAHLHQHGDVKDCDCQTETAHADVDDPFRALDGEVCPAWGGVYLIESESVS